MTGIGVVEILLLISCAIGLFMGIVIITLMVIFLRQGTTSQTPLQTRDHGSLVGLQDDSHIQYLLTKGLRPMSGDLDLGNNHINNMRVATVNGQAVPFEQSLKDGDAARGDLSGSYPAPKVAGLQGLPVSSIPPSTGQVLIWNGTEWEPRDPT